MNILDAFAMAVTAVAVMHLGMFVAGVFLVLGAVICGAGILMRNRSLRSAGSILIGFAPVTMLLLLIYLATFVP